MKRIVSRACLWFAAIWWGIWFGGQLFNALMVVPYFSANPPQSLAEWAQLFSTSLAGFFLIFSPIWIVIALAVSLGLGWASYGDGRGWVLGSLVAGLVSVLILAGWMSPTFGRLMNPQDATISMVEIQTTLYRWSVANWGRMVIEFDGFVCALLALSRG
jgi:hypothetical protein